MTRTTSEPPRGLLLWATQGTAAGPRALSRTSRFYHAGEPMLLALCGPDKQLAWWLP
jgi:chorismate-pyruvate lyase